METPPYLFTVNLCWAISFFCYCVLFQTHPFFTPARFSLLVTLLAGINIPAMEFQESLPPGEIITKDLVTVQGLVTDEDDVPLPNAAITFSDSYRATVTTASGRFEIDSIPVGSKMTIIHSGFEQHSLRIRRKADMYKIRLKSFGTAATVSAKKTTRKQFAQKSETTRPGIQLDRWPRYPGGQKGRNKFIANTLKYPQQAIRDGVEGQVSVSFLINGAGNVSDPRIEKGVREDIDNEAIRIISLMPDWFPAQKNGSPVPVRYTMNILFNIEVEKLPLEIREETPSFFRNAWIYTPPKMQPIGNKHLREFFGDSEVDLRDSLPPKTTLYFYRAVMYQPVPEKLLDLRIKIPKK